MSFKIWQHINLLLMHTTLVRFSFFLTHTQYFIIDEPVEGLYVLSANET
jgi:hypothetical protein